jgi:hypothetical protein
MTERDKDMVLIGLTLAMSRVAVCSQLDMGFCRNIGRALGRKDDHWTDEKVMDEVLETLDLGGFRCPDTDEYEQ